MRASLMFPILALAVLGASGCAKVEDPWVGRGEGSYWSERQKELIRAPEQEAELRQRALSGQVDRATGVQQINRTG